LELNNNYNYEIDFLPVGDGERSGDAIAMRWQTPNGYYVAVVDGGTKDSGERLMEHVRTQYGATFINLAINTHPDQDHASGLQVILENMRVDQLWMHRPWAHPEKIRHLFANTTFTTAGLSGRIKSALDCAYELERIADHKRIPIAEPFEGVSFGPLLVLSPNREFYLSLIPHFNNTPEARYGLPQGLLAAAIRAARNTVASVAETWGVETLREDGTTSPQNESSVVLYARFKGHGILLTADAGQRALANAFVYAHRNGIRLHECTFYQVPHHGSRRNVGPTVLDAILGAKLPAAIEPTRFAIASVSAGSTTHPRKAVCNAFRRRGVGVVPTHGGWKRVYSGYPARPSGQEVAALSLYGTVEDYD
jgi:beta-lactamase superfamily II metal-dependent hydrolase